MTYTDGGHVYYVRMRDTRTGKDVGLNFRSTFPTLLDCAQAYNKNPFQFEVTSIVERKPRVWWLRKILGEY